MNKKWLINVSEEPNIINATLDNGMSLKHVFILCQSFQAINVEQEIKEVRLLAVLTRNISLNFFPEFLSIRENKS